jgi:hypothetical protein
MERYLVSATLHHRGVLHHYWLDHVIIVCKLYVSVDQCILNDDIALCRGACILSDFARNWNFQP